MARIVRAAGPTAGLLTLDVVQPQILMEMEGAAEDYHLHVLHHRIRDATWVTTDADDALALDDLTPLPAVAPPPASRRCSIQAYPTFYDVASLVRASQASSQLWRLVEVLLQGFRARCTRLQGSASTTWTRSTPSRQSASLAFSGLAPAGDAPTSVSSRDPTR